MSIRSKKNILKRGFKNIDEEILFLKYQKPTIVAKLIYYNAIYKIETKKPYRAKPTRKYLNKELKKLKRFSDNNLDFYKYYRSDNSFLDENFFIRGNHDIKLWLDTYYLQSDQSISLLLCDEILSSLLCISKMMFCREYFIAHNFVRIT